MQRRRGRRVRRRLTNINTRDETDVDSDHHHRDPAVREETDPSQGVQLETIQSLAAYWATDYDWRRFEQRFAALPHYITEIDGWPGSTVEQLKIIDPLTNPTQHGATAADAFHLVIPSLPGHGFSGKPTETGWDPIRIARGGSP